MNKKKLSDRIHWYHIVLILLAIAFLMWNPITRAIIIFILPLGSGIDDLIVIGALALAGTIFWLGGWQALFELFRRK